MSRMLYCVLNTDTLAGWYMQQKGKTEKSGIDQFQLISVPLYKTVHIFK